MDAMWYMKCRTSLSDDITISKTGLWPPRVFINRFPNLILFIDSLSVNNYRANT